MKDIDDTKSSNIIDHRPVASHGFVALLGLLFGLTMHVDKNDPQVALVEVASSTLDHAQTFWSSRVQGWHDARVVLYTDKEPSPCGQADQTTGPFYCPSDEHVYLDLSFLASINGDLARAYVVAHEIGHHVQKLRGEFAGRPSIDIELEADCYAGMWASDEQKRGMLDVGDVSGALVETAAVGDDRICPGCSVEQWTHGSSAMRTAAFRQGLAGGQCLCAAGVCK